MKIKYYFGHAALFFFALSIFPGCSDQLETREMVLGGETFTVEIAKTPKERAEGLMHRKKLKEGRGMLFVFKRDQKLSFYMKNTHIPLSIAYIAKDGEIKEIYDMTPLSLRPINSKVSVRYALEVNQGDFERLGLKPGDRVILPEDF